MSLLISITFSDVFAGKTLGNGYVEAPATCKRFFPKFTYFLDFLFRKTLCIAKKHLIQA
ncbi:MAG: hypothetical protein ACTSRH_09865 [Promethearchaeota archaeon]